MYSVLAWRTEGSFLGKTKIMNFLGLLAKSILLARIMEMRQLALESDSSCQLTEVMFCRLVKVVCRGGKRNLSHRL